MSELLPPTDRSLPFALLRARETVMAPIRQMLADTGLTEQQWRILRVLSETGALDSANLAQRASLLPPSVTRIVKSMSDRGLVEQHTSKTDRRRTLVSITPAGIAVIEENLAQALSIAGSYKTRLGKQRYETLLDLLDALCADEP